MKVKKWAFGFVIREWFLSPKNWDQYYDVGDSREVGVMFYANSPDEEAARQMLHDRAEEDDQKIEILAMNFKQEVEVEEEVVQKPISRG